MGKKTASQHVSLRMQPAMGKHVMLCIKRSRQNKCRKFVNKPSEHTEGVSTMLAFEETAMQTDRVSVSMAPLITRVCDN